MAVTSLMTLAFSIFVFVETNFVDVPTWMKSDEDSDNKVMKQYIYLIEMHFMHFLLRIKII